MSQDRPRRQPSRGSAPAAGPVAADLRDRHELSDERGHAQRVVDNLRRFAGAQRLKQSMLAAVPRSAAVVRERIEPAASSDLERLELPAKASLELPAKASLRQIHHVLAKQRTLPEPDPTGWVHDPRGQGQSTR